MKKSPTIIHTLTIFNYLLKSLYPPNWIKRDAPMDMSFTYPSTDTLSFDVMKEKRSPDIRISIDDKRTSRTLKILKFGCRRLEMMHAATTAAAKTANISTYDVMVSTIHSLTSMTSSIFERFMKNNAVAPAIKNAPTAPDAREILQMTEAALSGISARLDTAAAIKKMQRRAQTK